MLKIFHRPTLLLSAFFPLLGVDLALSIPPPLSPLTGDHQTLSQRPLATNNEALDDGIYLYGETSEPEQIGKAYVVFEVRRGQVIGAFYMPHSSFDCAYGSAEQSQLDVTIINSYDQTTYRHTLFLDKFQRLTTVSANDQRILSTCTQTYQKQVGNW